MYGIVVQYPQSGDICVWYTDDAGKWARWCRRLEGEGADYLAFC